MPTPLCYHHELASKRTDATDGKDDFAMNNELLTVINYLERDRGINREVLIQAVEYALQSAARKGLGASHDLRIDIDRKTLDIKAFDTKTVTETPHGDDEVSLEQARSINPDAQVGDTVEVQIQPQGLGRIAAQTAKQAIMQKIRQAERENVFEAYKDRVGDIVSGTVKHVQRGDIVVDLDRAEALLPHRERVPGEEYRPGDRIRAYLMNAQPDALGPAILLSRASTDFVRALFRYEVSEIAEGMVEIMSIARDPGLRTKIAVRSHDEKVDPVGACVGMRGARVKNIVRELNGEKIDIVRWNADLRLFATQALAPAQLLSINADPADPRKLNALVNPENLSLAIGKRGQNVRLASKLVGCSIDIRKAESELTFEEQVEKAVANLETLEGVTREQAVLLVESGFLTPEGILAVDAAELSETTGLDPEVSALIWQSAALRLGEDEALEEQPTNPNDAAALRPGEDHEA